ncbi:MAG: nicotinamidase [Candidatus Calescibacterium sp.]|nr:nicotinamidase [Candidatus Calescibacterium sp.]
MIKLNKNSALIIVDMQNDFLPPNGALPVPDGDKVIPVINQYIEKFKGNKIFATADWHPENHISFKERGGPWPPHCIQNSKGAEFHNDLNLPDGVEVIKKASDPDKDAYSGFEGTDLAQKLRESGIDTVFICGVATEYCVKNTVLDAVKYGFRTYLLQDAIKGIDEKDSKKAIEEMKEAGAILIQLKDISEKDISTREEKKKKERAKGQQQIVGQLANKIKEASEQIIKDVSKEIKKKSKEVSKDIGKIVKKSKKDLKKIFEREKKKVESKAAEFVAETIKKVVESLGGEKRGQQNKNKKIKEIKKIEKKNLPRVSSRGKEKKGKGGGKTMATTKKGSAKPKQKAKSKKAKK